MVQFYTCISVTPCIEGKNILNMKNFSHSKLIAPLPKVSTLFNDCNPSKLT